MRPEDALKLNIGHIHRELNLGNIPFAICFLPEKDRNTGIGERITFLGSDGVEILKEYIECRKMKGEKKVAIETGDTTLHIFFTLENQAVLQTLTTLAVQGQVWIKIVGAANLNLKLFSYDLLFEQEILVPL